LVPFLTHRSSFSSHDGITLLMCAPGLRRCTDAEDHAALLQLMLVQADSNHKGQPGPLLPELRRKKWN